jgi:peptide/nickel transport system substrate-binding protein
MKRTAFRLLVVSSLLLAIAAAGRTRPRYGGALRIEIRGTGWEDSGLARKLVGETLTSIDDKGQVQPWLAQSWESQNGGRRWVFRLRSDVRFHDGSLLTPSTVAQALSASGCRNCPWRSARAAGETVVFESDAPMPLLPAQLSMTRFAVTKTGDNAFTIGTGPFQVDQVNGGTTVLKSFDDYWQAAPYLDAVTIMGGRSVREQWLDLSVGRADVVEVPADQMRKLQQNKIPFSSTKDLELLALVIGANNSALQDGRIRQAISESIDRSSLLNVIFQRQGEVTGTLLPNWLTGFGPLYPTARNLDHARELRGQWLAPVSPLTIGYDPADTTSQLLAERIALNIREIGLTVQAIPQAQHTGVDMYVTRVTLPSLEPSVAIEEIAAALGLGADTPDDMTLESAFQREHDLVTDYKAVPLLYLPDSYATGDRVHDWRVRTDGTPTMTEAWIEVRP